MHPGVSITINGAVREVREGQSLAELLSELGLPATGIAVERNRHLVRAQDFASVSLAAGDQIEVVTLVGGG
jgi:sulfur carrier protein